MSNDHSSLENEVAYHVQYLYDLGEVNVTHDTSRNRLYVSSIDHASNRYLSESSRCLSSIHDAEFLSESSILMKPRDYDDSLIGNPHGWIENEGCEDAISDLYGMDPLYF